MTRRTFLSLLAVALMAIVATFTAGSATASAQPIKWCGSNCYTVDLSALAGFPNCVPCIRTSWNGSATVWPPAAACGNAAGGVYNVCPIPVQPIGSPLDWVSVCGVTLPGVQGQYSVPTACPGCPPLCVRLCVTPTGCLVIKVYPGSCPVAPLPCP